MAGDGSTAGGEDPGLALLGIYLNDHLAGATGGLELFRRAASSHRGTDLGGVLRRLSEEVAEDRRALLDMMGALGVPARQYKLYAAWLLEKIGRFKPNGRLLLRSALSDLVELEALRLGVEGKAAGWRTLRVAAGRYDCLDPDRLDGLIAQAGRQADTLEEARMAAAGEVVAATGQS